MEGDRVIGPFEINQPAFGDALELAKQLPDESIHCIVTSPPYWGVRDYQVEGQLGLEATPGEYIDKMIVLFRELRRVLRSDGTLWLNLGDCYCTHPNVGTGWESSTLTKSSGRPRKIQLAQMASMNKERSFEELKPKDLVGIPWRVALALQADGWYLRSDIIWHKPNPLPESVRDRPTKAHEYIFLMAKSGRYFFDINSIKEPSIYGGECVSIGEKSLSRGQATGMNVSPSRNAKAKTVIVTITRNKRSVWTVPSEPFPGPHFATFPQKLIRPCILAGTSEKGACPKCGTPWSRVTEPSDELKERLGSSWHDHNEDLARGQRGCPPALSGPSKITTGWKPICDCGSSDTVPCVVLDPFIGSGTTGQVCQDLGRWWIGFDLDERNRELIEKRTAQAGLFGVR